MEPMVLVKELGGGLGAVVIVTLGFMNWIQYRRNERLIDQLLECAKSNSSQTTVMHEKTLATVASLTAATQANNATAQAALSMLERDRGR